MDGNRQTETTTFLKVGVAALVVIAAVAVGGGVYWYGTQHALPTCGSPEATDVIVKIASENVTKELTAEQAATFARLIKLSLDMVEKGELSADGNVRRCAASLKATLAPDMRTFASAREPDGLHGVQKEAPDTFSVPIEYELKALDNDSSRFLGSLPGSLPLIAFRGALTVLARTYEPRTPQTKQAADEAVPAIVGASFAPAAPSDWKSVVQAAAELATVPASETSTALGWEDVAGKLPALTWSEMPDKDFAVVKRAFVAQGTANDPDLKPGFTIVLKGARTMVLETEIEQFDVDADLLDLFVTAVPTQLVRCDSDEGVSSFERWYRVMPAGSKPLFAHATSSSGNAGTTETLTFSSNATLPTVGDDSINGKWTDSCTP